MSKGVVHLDRNFKIFLLRQKNNPKPKRHIHVFIDDVVIIIELFDSKHANGCRALKYKVDKAV